jgi:hypothetical protein
MNLDGFGTVEKAGAAKGFSGKEGGESAWETAACPQRERTVF